jgi:hypothetical protein
MISFGKENSKFCLSAGEPASELKEAISFSPTRPSSLMSSPPFHRRPSPTHPLRISFRQLSSKMVFPHQQQAEQHPTSPPSLMRTTLTSTAERSLRVKRARQAAAALVRAKTRRQSPIKTLYSHLPIKTLTSPLRIKTKTSCVPIKTQSSCCLIK